MVRVVLSICMHACRAADTIIGGPMRRGVSGGERKRVNVGHEMMTDPSLLFLDEPTSGLDSTTSLRLVNTLKLLASSGRTIVTSLHQPSSKMFQAFDRLILLAEGRVMFYGPAAKAMEYFASLGYEPKYAVNPADYILDLATGEPSGARSALWLWHRGRILELTDSCSRDAGESREYLLKEFRRRSRGDSRVYGNKQGESGQSEICLDKKR